MHRLAQALGYRKWDQAAGLLLEEMALRRDITPDALIPLTDKLVRQSNKAGWGVRFEEAGAGRSVRALGEKKTITEGRTIWSPTLARIRRA